MFTQVLLAQHTAAEKLAFSFTYHIVEPIVWVLAVSAFLVFIWGIISFIFNVDDLEKKETGKKHIIWGIVGMFVLFSVGAIIHSLREVSDGFFLQDRVIMTITL